MKLEKGKLVKVLNQLEEYSCRLSEIDEWVTNFIESFIDKLEPLSTEIWIIQNSLEIALGLKELEGDERMCELSIIKYYKEKIKEEGGYEEVKSFYNELKELEDWFMEFDI